MPMPPKPIEMISELIARPSISSTSVQWNQPNLGVIELLHGWSIMAVDFPIGAFI